MKISNLLIAALFLAVFVSPVSAQNYTLKRAVITWNDGSVDDSALGGFSVNGSMRINGSRLVQDITYCESGVCDHVVQNSGGAIISVGKNTAKVTIRADDGYVDDLTLLTLSPSIITLFAYDDGTVETHEWQPVEPFSKRQEKQTGAGQPAGAIGRGIASKIRN